MQGQLQNEIISYLDMCREEGVNLQQGMNFRLGGGYSVILMSVRRNAPYRDEVVDNGLALIYEGHDAPRTDRSVDPKAIDQPQFTTAGTLTQNGKFHQASHDFKRGIRPPELVKVYEKIRSGIWASNGLFHLVDSWIEHDGVRNVFKFRLQTAARSHPDRIARVNNAEPTRVIPTSVKLEVWKRDGGKCVICAVNDELHFDHVIPFSKGGTSLKADNIQLLCARHNLEKKDRIE